jgi:hypothetical protein
VVAGLVWPAGDRALGTPAQAYLCLGTFRGSVVNVLQSGSPLSVQPTRFPGPELSAVYPVTVTATASGTTTLQLRVDRTPAGKPEVLRTVALVVADDERWHFERAG